MAGKRRGPKQRKEALSVQRLINEVLVQTLGIPSHNIVNDAAFSRYTDSQRPDILISNVAYLNNPGDIRNEEDFINNLICYAEAKDISCKVDDADWKDAIRQGWDALGKGMHNVGHSLKNSGRAWNRFVSGWQDAKQAANAAHSNPNNTVMRDFWDGQFKRFGDWSKGHGWSIGNTIMNARTGYTDFRGIHDMKNIAAVGTHRTVWDTMNFGQHVVSYANATYDTLNTAKVVKPFVNPTADGGLQWKHSPQDYFKTLVPDPDQLWNSKTIYQAPGKLSDGAAEASNAIRVGISDL